jgi:hypothetical protein
LGQPLKDRRRDVRYDSSPEDITRATLRPGCLVRVLDVSASGALVQADRPLRPGARLHFQLVIGQREFGLIARVVRCAVWMLDSHEGIRYRGALEFEERFHWLWETETLSGSSVPASALPTTGEKRREDPTSQDDGRGVDAGVRNDGVLRHQDSGVIPSFHLEPEAKPSELECGTGTFNQGTSMAPQTFGNRFLTEFRRLNGSTRNWPDRAVTLLDRADRRRFIDALEKASSTTAKRLVIAAHTAEPEKLAKRAVELNTSKAGQAELLVVVLDILAGGSS